VICFWYHRILGEREREIERDREREIERRGGG